MSKLICVSFYLFSMVFANWMVGVFGPQITPINALLLIGVDLALRDYMQVKFSIYTILALVLVSSGISYLTNTAPVNIAIASAVAFLVSQCVDTVVFVFTRGDLLTRSTKSNVAGACVDSLLFPFLAFGVFLPTVALLQFICKVFGGFVFGYFVMRKVVK